MAQKLFSKPIKQAVPFLVFPSNDGLDVKAGGSYWSEVFFMPKELVILTFIEPLMSNVLISFTVMTLSRYNFSWMKFTFYYSVLKIMLQIGGNRWSNITWNHQVNIPTMKLFFALFFPSFLLGLIWVCYLKICI